MRLTLSCSGDVGNFKAANQQGVGDQRPVATPEYGLRAGIDRSLFLNPTDQLFQSLSKSLRLHVIGIASEAGVLPTGIGAILKNRLPKSAQALQVQVFDAGVP